MENKKGLSAIITTLMIILLVLVAVGIVWVVVRDVVEEGTESVGAGAKCPLVDLRILGNTTECESGTDNCAVQIERKAGGDALAGVMISVSNATASDVTEVTGDIGELETVIKAADGIDGASSIAVSAYFVDTSGNNVICTGGPTRNI